MVVLDLERAEAGPRRRTRRLKLVPRTRTPCISVNRRPSGLLYEKTSAWSEVGGGSEGTLFPHLPGLSLALPAGFGTSPRTSVRGGCRGFIGPVPPPLVMWCSYVADDYTSGWPRGRSCGSPGRRFCVKLAAGMDDANELQQEPADAEPPSPQAAQDHLAAGSSLLCRAEPLHPAHRGDRGQGLRWLHIDDPNCRRAGLAGGALRVPPAGLRGRALAQPAPQDRQVRGLPVHRAPLPGLRQRSRQAGGRASSTSSSAPAS